MSRSAVAFGGAVFGAVMMIVAGAWQVLMGIAAMVKGGSSVVVTDYAYEFSPIGWGWVHVIVGTAAMAVGLALFTGKQWARLCGLGIASFSLISNFLWLPFEPWWSIVIIAADAFIIWSLLNVGNRLDFLDAQDE